MDTYPIPASSLERYFKVCGKSLAQAYRDHLSGFNEWEQRDNAASYMLLPDNTGERLCIDETMLSKDLFTFVSNKDGHGRHGSVVAAVRGTMAATVSNKLMCIPEEKRLSVKEITMDFSDSMFSIARQAFPNAEIVIDCFHIMKRVTDGIEELRMQEKRAAAAERRKQEKEHKDRLRKSEKRRAEYAARKTTLTSGKKRGRKPIRKNARFEPEKLFGKETKLDMLTRVRYALCKERKDLGCTQQQRLDKVLSLYPKLKTAYELACDLRRIFKSHISRDLAKVELERWRKNVEDMGINEIKGACDTIISKEEYVLNYFNNRSTNASAESLNSKMKGFRSQLRGVKDLPFFMYRVSRIFG